MSAIQEFWWKSCSALNPTYFPPIDYVRQYVLVERRISLDSVRDVNQAQEVRQVSARGVGISEDTFWFRAQLLLTTTLMKRAGSASVNRLNWRVSWQSQ